MHPHPLTRVLTTTASLLICAAPVTQAREPIYPGLGSYSRKITTDSRLAQRYSTHGLALLHGFNHAAAIRSFQEAARLDPECAMAHWGIALAAGIVGTVPVARMEARTAASAMSSIDGAAGSARPRAGAAVAVLN